VIRLRAQATPQCLCGRVEHVNSGDGFDFADADTLLRLLREHATAQPGEQTPRA
jgi:hypothetical protein